jgi:hypothetical protein
MKIGVTTIPLAGWVADPRLPEEAREARLRAIRQIVEGYRLATVELSLEQAVLAKLQELGYTGTIILENHTQADLEESLKVLGRTLHV